MVAQPFSRMRFTPVTLPLRFRQVTFGPTLHDVLSLICHLPSSVMVALQIRSKCHKEKVRGRQGPAVTFSPFLLLLAKLYYPYMSVNGQIYSQIPCWLDDTVGNGAKIRSLIETNP